MRNRVLIETWGCQMNLHHSEGIAGVLERAGYCIVDSLDRADVVLFNTCTVRQKAEDKAISRIGAVAKMKAERRLLLGVGGCMPQVRGASLLDRLPEVDFLFGSGDIASLPRLIEASRSGRRVAHLPAPTGIETLPHRRAAGVRAAVTITEGCSSCCSYCVVPQARGPLRSRPPGAVIAEVERAVEQRFVEILLLGQNVDSYGVDRPEYGTFAALLERVAAAGPRRVRFTSSHPRDLSQEVIDAVAASPVLCNHLHLACQSGSDTMLATMNRGYTRAEFVDIVRRARIAVPGINVTTDLIVGHPGETEEDFLETLRLVEEVQFGAAFVAAYSPRPGTRSALLEDDVPAAEKSARLQRVLDRQREIAGAANARRIGQTVEVLIEGPARGGGSCGLTDDHRMVVAAEPITPGRLVRVTIEAATPSALRGRAAMPVGVEG